MNRSDLIQRLAESQPDLPAKVIEIASRLLIEALSNSIATGNRIEIRSFGTFNLHLRTERWARNPKTGEKVFVSSKHVPHFKPGKALHKRLNDA